MTQITTPIQRLVKKATKDELTHYVKSGQLELAEEAKKELALRESSDTTSVVETVEEAPVVEQPKRATRKRKQESEEE